MRAIFFDPADAETAVTRLVAAGYTASSVRERLHGEDDDEDHPWAVTSDAPEFVLDLLVDELDGWLDFDDQTPPSPLPPLDLPAAPQRIKRPDAGSAPGPSEGPDTLAP